MTPNERIEAAIRLKKPDRVPLAPFAMFFTAVYAGITMEEYLFDKDKCERAADKTFEDFGGWDAWYMYPFINGLTTYLYPKKYKMPGIDLPPDRIYQLDDSQVMTVDDYDILISKGYGNLFRLLLNRSYPDKDRQQLNSIRTKFKEDRLSYIAKYSSKGIPTINGFLLNSPFDELCLLRSTESLMLDMYRIPDKLEEALAITTDALIEIVKRNAPISDAKGFFLACYRMSGAFLSIKQFEKFAFPYLRKMVEELTKLDILVVFHADTNWTKNLEYFKEFPKGKCLLSLDGFTDIFRAKEILKGHMCILGDLRPSLLTLGTPSEVEDYCKKLIDRVGEDGGLIIGSGDEVPPDTKPANFRAMIDTVKEYGVY